MNVTCPDFDNFILTSFPDIYRFSFFLTANPEDAWAAAFQTLLYMGTKGTQGTMEEASPWCIRTCKDLFYRKIRRRRNREKLQKLVAFPISDPLWMLLKKPLHIRIRIFLEYLSGYPGLPPEQKEAISSILPPADGPERMQEEIWLRFEERNVPLENKLRILRSHWDHIVIGLAAAILLLFAAAVWYTAGLQI